MPFPSNLIKEMKNALLVTQELLVHQIMGSVVNANLLLLPILKIFQFVFVLQGLKKKVEVVFLAQKDLSNPTMIKPFVNLVIISKPPTKLDLFPTLLAFVK